jgi:hypothetical protein
MKYIWIDKNKFNSENQMTENKLKKIIDIESYS